MTMKRFASSIHAADTNNTALPSGNLTWDSSNGLRLHDGSTAGGNPIGVNTAQLTNFLNTFTGVVGASEVLGTGTNVEIIAGSYAWTFDTTGELSGNGTAVTLTASSGTTTSTWIFNYNSDLTVPGHIFAQPSNDLDIKVYNADVNGGTTFSVQNWQVDIGSRTTQFSVAPNEINLSTNFGAGSNRNQWIFNADGTLYLANHAAITANSGHNIRITTGAEGGAGSSEIVLQDNGSVVLATNAEATQWTFDQAGTFTTPNGLTIDSNNQITAAAGHRLYLNSNNRVQLTYDDGSTQNYAIVSSNGTELRTAGGSLTFDTSGILNLPNYAFPFTGGSAGQVLGYDIAGSLGWVYNISDVTVPVQASTNITNGQAVMANTGTNGILLAQPLDITAAGFKPEWYLGLAYGDINSSNTGYILKTGLIDGIDTTLFAEGDTLWANPATPGSLVNAEPTPGVPHIIIGKVLKKSSNGIVYVQKDVRPYLNGLVDVNLTNPQAGQSLVYNTVTNSWVNATVSGGTGTGGISLSNLSVNVVSASGDGNLTYDNGTGVFTFTPANLSSYVSSSALLNYVLKTDFAASLTNYVLSSTLAGYGYTTTATVNSLIANSLTNYVTNSTLASYGYTNTATVNSLIANSLTNFVYTGTINYNQLTNVPADLDLYTTTATVNSLIANSLTNYVTSSALAGYGYTTTATVNSLIANSLTNYIQNNTTATQSTLGLIKVGSNLSITGDGTLTFNTASLVNSTINVVTVGSQNANASYYPTVAGGNNNNAQQLSTVAGFTMNPGTGLLTVAQLNVTSNGANAAQVNGYNILTTANTGSLSVSYANTAGSVVGGIGVSSLTAGTGTFVSAASGAVTTWIGQDVSTTANVTFNNVTANGDIYANGTRIRSTTSTFYITTSTPSYIQIGGSTATVAIPGTLQATAAVGNSTNSASAVGYLGIPPVNTGSNYTIGYADQGKFIYVTATSVTITIPDNLTTPLPVGAAVNIVTAGYACTISTITDTLILGGVGTLGVRTLSTYGMATVMKVTTNTWYISGAGVS